MGDSDTITCEILNVITQTHDVKTFTLDPERDVDFVPGQFSVFSIPDDEEHEDAEKPFTFANSPVSGRLEITVKEVGDFTTALHSLESGDRLEMSEPFGSPLEFNEDVEEDVVFLAGGSGITPFMSALRYSMDKNLGNDITVIYSNKTQKDIIYREDLERLAQTSENIDVFHTLTREEPDGWDGETGRIDEDMVEKYVDNIQDKLWYVCGPMDMAKAMEDMLSDMGVPGEKIKTEEW
ncbi:MAG: ferredoxin--NADP reductase [Candidatus Aenigmatarchaeota archaeon]